uniref:Uncharacterized protein n=1 Tax=Knipowitschia caucasica TaxID=637954 RepID=A0AAV2JLQ0_KNICA
MKAKIRYPNSDCPAPPGANLEKLRCSYCEKLRLVSKTLEDSEDEDCHHSQPGVVTLLNDRINSTSMSKVQRMLQLGHDEWYVERRDLWPPLLIPRRIYSAMHDHGDGENARYQEPI